MRSGSDRTEEGPSDGVLVESGRADPLAVPEVGWSRAARADGGAGRSGQALAGPCPVDVEGGGLAARDDVRDRARREIAWVLGSVHMRATQCALVRRCPHVPYIAARGSEVTAERGIVRV